MKSIVIYLSQTGNTEKIAKAIQAGITKEAGQCDLVKLRDANPRGLAEYDLIGIGSPTWGPEPVYIDNFLKEMRWVGGKHIFAFNTHGSSPDIYWRNIYPELARPGLTVIGWKDWYGDCYLLHHCYPYPSQGHPDEVDLKEAEAFGREMADHSRRIYAGETDLIPKPLEPFGPGGQDAYVRETVTPMEGLDDKGADNIFLFREMLKYHEEKCRYPQCHICIDNCPSYGFDFTRTPRVWADPCGECGEWCVRLCPTGAIECDEWLELMKEHMDIMTQRDVLPRFAKAEKEGRFRRLLPVEKVTGTLNYEVFKGRHPQWIIGKGLNLPKKSLDTK